ncbi:MAG: NADH-quinone oxidoreductase subunit L [Pseudomonadota bacterium]|nr:NADH-quinone oxidoreductase subunit L [Pseudomonadota bacterium]
MYALAVFLPLIAAIVAGLGGRWLKDAGSQFVTCGALLASAVISVVMLFDVAVGGNPHTVELFAWMSSGKFEVLWALRFDQLTAVMMFVVTVVSAMVHVYSIGYMHHDPSIPRFMAYLSLFTFFMLMLVTSDNFVQMFFGWEGVGLCSYFLIGFWYDRPSANAAAIKAFLVNRVGDFGFALGIMGVFFIYEAVSFDKVFAATPELSKATIHFLGAEFHALTVLCILLFIGAMGKSAQLGLHTWLPDAMEGPTPVSALIHAATMVTAGVFMVARLSPMFEYSPVALSLVVIVGASTAFFAATIGLCQNDIKRVIAYSTCSQLGYMFFACGVSAYSAGIFHLTTHAFFKALLFLGAGSVIHAMSSEQDMRKMGGLWRLIPLTYTMMWVGSLALAGIPFFAGFYSKDMILESAFAAHTGLGLYAFWLGIAAAVMTAFYSWRLLIMTFHGESRADEKTLAHVHESPKSMTIPLLVLAICAIFSGYIGVEYFVGEHMAAFWGKSIFVMEGNNVIEAAHHVPFWVKALTIIVALAGIGLAYAMYMGAPNSPARLAAAIRPIYLFVYNKWYFDELYDRIFVRPAFYLGRGLWKEGDGTMIDGIGPDGISAAVRVLARRASALQTGYVYHYAFAMLIGVAGLVTWYLYGHAG